mmetsp:Transcript_5196/g.12676  ORF Transcript_5196/g.12676 Transcript_5196/m.12676 type:complete len:254 (-) Transcript_5196:62-823(-)
MNRESEKRAQSFLPASAIANLSRGSIVRTSSMASAYSSRVFARNPVCCTVPSARVSGTTMSALGPPLSLAMGTAPAAMYSTTPMPKCSSTIVCRPAAAEPRRRMSSARGTLTQNSTQSSTPSSLAASLRASMRRLSSSWRQLPARRSRAERTTQPAPPVELRALRLARAKASICVRCAFSGRNCATDTIRGGPSEPRSSGRAWRAAVSHGGKTFLGGQRRHQRLRMWPSVHEELTITTDGQAPAAPYMRANAW